MRLLPLSDLHLERRSLADVPALDPGFDVLVCAGDIWEGEPERGLRAVAHLAAGRPAVIVPGNHEHYGPRERARPYPDLLGALKAEEARLGAAGHRLHLLSGGREVHLGAVRFLGATLWSDWSLATHWREPLLGESTEVALAAAMSAATDVATGSREYGGAIRHADGALWTPRDAIAAHERERSLLTQALLTPWDGPTVVVTHYPPLVTGIDAYRDWPGAPWWLPAFYATRLLEQLPPSGRPQLWVSGHFHVGHDLAVDGTRCVANPVEGATFDPGRIVAVG